MKRLRGLLLALLMGMMSGALATPDPPHILIHLRTGMADGGAQLRAAYDVIWAALEEGLRVKVLIDADALTVYQRGWRGKDDIEARKLTEPLRHSLARQFAVPLREVPLNYGDYLAMLSEKGAAFYVNGTQLVAAGVEEQAGSATRLSAAFFTPVDLREIVDLRASSEIYLAY